MIILLLLSFQTDSLNIAVLHFDNFAGGRYDTIVDAIPLMLTTTLAKDKGLHLVERIQISKALENFKIEALGGIDFDAAVKIGKWLGADAVILGSLVREDNLFRIDARVIDVNTGNILTAAYSKGYEIMSIVDTLGIHIIKNIGVNRSETGTGTLEIFFKLQYLPISVVRKIYHQIVRLYIDSTYIGISPPVKKVNKWVRIFSVHLPAGKEYEIELRHGYVEQDKWSGEFSAQPKKFKVNIGKNKVTEIRYSYLTGFIFKGFKYKQ